MEKNKLKNLLNSIKSRANLEMDLSELISEATSSFAEEAMYNLASCYYMDAAEGYFSSNEENRQAIDLVNRVIEKQIIGSDTLEINQIIEDIQAMRKLICDKAYLFLSLNNEVALLMHILDRKRPKYEDNLQTYSDEEMATLIINNIVKNKDSSNALINSAMSHLPVRITKNKLVTMVQDAFTLYKGGSVEILDDYISMLEDSSMVEFPSENSKYKEIYQRLMNIKATIGEDYDKARFIELENMLIEEAENIELMGDEFVSIMGILNNLFAVLLVNPYVIADTKIIIMSKSIIREVFEEMKKATDIENFEELLVNCNSYFSRIDRNIEELSYINGIAAKNIEEIAQTFETELDSMLLTSKMKVLLIVKDFFTDNMFMHLDSDKQDEDRIVDNEILREKQAYISTSIAKMFEGNSKPVNRAIMASILGKLPIQFNTFEDFKEYVFNSFKQCGDIYEKIASVRAIIE